jgi:hypothetical protein
VQTKAEFIDEHWDEILEIDLKMRHVANVAIKEFFGEDSNVPSLLRQEDFDPKSSVFGMLSHLAYCYSYKALSERHLFARSMVEFLIFLVIQQSALGDDAVAFAIDLEVLPMTIRIGMKGNKVEGEERYQVGSTLLRSYYSLMKSLPSTYEEMAGNHKVIKRKSFRLIWTRLKEPKRTKQEKEDIRFKESMSIQGEIEGLCRAWNLSPENQIDIAGWMTKTWEEPEA